MEPSSTLRVSLSGSFSDRVICETWFGCCSNVQTSNAFKYDRLIIPPIICHTRHPTGFFIVVVSLEIKGTYLEHKSVPVPLKLVAINERSLLFVWALIDLELVFG